MVVAVVVVVSMIVREQKWKSTVSATTMPSINYRRLITSGPHSTISSSSSYHHHHHPLQAILLMVSRLSSVTYECGCVGKQD